MITDIKAKDIKRLLLRVYKRYSSGAITEAQAYKETYLLNSVLKASVYFSFKYLSFISGVYLFDK